MAETDPVLPEAAEEFVASRLEQLMALPLATKEEVQRWYEQSAEFQSGVETRFPGFELEHDVWHFLADADIRSKEVGYRERQHQYVSDYVARLRHSRT